MNDGAMLWLRAKIGYAHDWWGDSKVTTQFVSLPTASFTVNTVSQPENLALITAMSEMNLKNGVSLIARLDAEFSDRSTSWAGTGTFRYSW
jgi:uncharacterized protein with beta-barrel porin domain